MNKEIEVLDNVFPEEYFKSLQKMFLNNTFPWFMEPASVYENDNFPQLVHAIYREFEPCSESWQYLKGGILNALQPHGLYRVKANATPVYSEVVEKLLHVDLKEEDDTVTPHRVAILYINTNDGYTVFEDGSKVDSVANRMILFPGHLKHAGTTCTDQPLRVVVNINYL
jgi:hypothetical protein